MPAPDNWSFFQQCREAIEERNEQYQQRLDNATSIEEVEAIEKEAPSVRNTPECAAFYPRRSSDK